MTTRRTALALGLAAGGLSALAACGPNAPSGGGGAEDAESLRLAWWGNPVRDEGIRKAAADYQEESGVSIAPEPSDWGGYWDKLATQVASGEAPDIIQMDEKYLSEYGGRDVLLDLETAGLDVSGFEDRVVATGEMSGKGLLAICGGINTPVLLANPDVFAQAGLDIPDDSTWTWDDLLDVATRVSEATDDGTYGVAQLGLIQNVFQVYMRQLGKDQYTADGVGFDAEDATEFFTFGHELQESGAAPDAERAVEEIGQSLDQTLFGTGRCAIGTAWSNQVVAFDAALDGRSRMLRLPSMSGRAADVGLWYKSGLYYSVSARSKDPEAAVAFVDWFVNSPEAGRHLMVERGVPGNIGVREEISADLGDSDRKAVEFIDAIKDEIHDPPALTPQGGGQFEDILNRAGQDMLFGAIGPADAGTALYDEISSATIS